MRQERPFQDGPDIRFRQQGRRNIGQQGERQPPKGIPDKLIGPPHLEGHKDARCARDDPGNGQGDKEIQGSGHPSQVRRGLNRIANHYPQQGGIEQPARIVPANGREQALPGYLAQLGRKIHDHDHHRQSDRRGPQDGRPQLRARTGVGADGRAIDIRGPGNEPQAERTEHAMALRGRCPGCGTDLLRWRRGEIGRVLMIHGRSFVCQLLRGSHAYLWLVNTTRHPGSAGVVRDGWQGIGAAPAAGY
jgi:hypothetical protein